MDSHTEKLILAHWVYTRREWNNFLRQENRRKGFFYRLIHLIGFGAKKIIPEVKITPDKISVGETHHRFSTNNSSLRRVNILEDGKINVLEVRYDSAGANFEKINEVRIPVPKGKLKEAILVQEKLFSKQD